MRDGLDLWSKPPAAGRRYAVRRGCALNWVLVCIAVWASSAARASASDGPGECPDCNGSPLLCDRRYDQVAYATAHNAMSSRQDHWMAPNQNYNMARQLNDGVRAMMIDVHMCMGRPYLAHGNVIFGRKPLVEGLAEVRVFLEQHRNEVLTLVIENRAPPEALGEAFDQAGLLPYLYTHQRGLPFPTLRQMIDTNRRLVVFADEGGGTYPWLHPQWEFCFETPWKARHRDELTNRVNRGDVRNPLFIVNHFLTNPVASIRLAKEVNYNPFLMERVRHTMQEMRRMPNFITVDYYDMGNLFEVVDAVNGLPWTQRRTAPPEAVGPAALTPYATPRTAAEIISPDLQPTFLQ